MASQRPPPAHCTGAVSRHQNDFALNSPGSIYRLSGAPCTKHCGDGGGGAPVIKPMGFSRRKTGQSGFGGNRLEECLPA
jgi:hypothetical protein